MFLVPSELVSFCMITGAQTPESTDSADLVARTKVDISTADPRRGARAILRNIGRQPWFSSLCLLGADIYLVTIAYLISRAVRVNQALQMSPAYLLQVGTFFLCILIAVGLIGGYKARRTFRLSQFASEFALAVLLGAATGAFVLFVFFSAGDFYSAQSRVVLLYTTIGYAIPALGLRLLAAAAWTRRARRVPYLAIGTPQELQDFEGYCTRMDFHNPVVLADVDLHVVGELMDDQARALKVSPRSVLQAAARIGGSLPAQGADRRAHEFEGIVLTDPPESYPPALLEKLARLHFLRIPVYSEDAFFSEIWRKESVHRLDHSWALRQNFQLARHSAYRYIKTAADYILAVVALPIALPLMLLVGLAVLLDSGFPVFYRQERVGRGEGKFTLFKFRSMHVRDEEDDPYTRDKDSRVTRVGRFLRLTRLDELPQIFNVLRGEMSIVGPRAEWSRIVAGYETKIPSYHLRHLVKPGITGWAQVNYRYGADLDDAIEKLRYDLYYIKNYSLVLDIEILLKTVLKVFSFGGK
ncbi:MAG: exopolysaccharide biosynthesis polyprenyl glycosylphosphotransferase [Chthoniobacterales bacterium]|nr:exopolysaccharide biosynthesis polyprenyl glycosylphosphotransferase [Chthoniobacterales bacterium]